MVLRLPHRRGVIVEGGKVSNLDAMDIPRRIRQEHCAAAAMCMSLAER